MKSILILLCFAFSTIANAEDLILFSALDREFTNHGSFPTTPVRKYRNPAKVREFKKLHPCPTRLKVASTCKGIVDHICSLYSGGIDYHTNMQWQSYTESKAKDRVENTTIGKQLYCNPTNSTPTRQVFNKWGYL